MPFFPCTDELCVGKSNFFRYIFRHQHKSFLFFFIGNIYFALMISSISNFSDEQFVWVGIGIKARPGSACTTAERLLPVYLVRW